jgi:hypothetical protein
MVAKEFRALFGEVARAHGFIEVQGGWYRELPAALFGLQLQKSNFGAYFELNLKLFLGRALPKEAAALKTLTKMSGDIFRRQPTECRGAFDLDNDIGLDERRRLLEAMFRGVIQRIADGAGSPSGILALRDRGELFVLPAIETKLIANRLP